MKNKIIKDLNRINQKFLKEFPTSQILTRDYYREHGKYKDSQIAKIFGSFENLKKEVAGDLDLISYKKKLRILEDKNRALEKENNELLKTSIIEDDLILQYKISLSEDMEVKIDNTEVIIENDEDREALLHLSDWHVGEEVLPQAVNGVNAYNEEICLKRLDTVFNVFIAYCKKFNITKCHILLNGDNISGGIHEELVRNSWLNETEQIFFFQKYIIQKLEYMTQFFNKINVSCLVGNHARILQGRPYFKNKVQLNFEYIMGKNIQAYFEILEERGHNNKIFVDVPEGAFKIIEINGVKFLATHGDILTGAGSGGFAGIPFYSICMSAAKLYGVLHQIDVDSDTKFSHLIIGHLHSHAVIPLFNGGRCYVNGAGIGTNEYSLTKMKSIASLCQLMLIISKDGRLELEKNITFE